MKYNFITEQERTTVIEYMLKTKNDRDQAQLTGLYAPNSFMLEVPSRQEFPIIHQIIDRALSYAGLLSNKDIIHGNGSRFGSGFVIYKKGSLSQTHKDPIDKIKYPEKSLFRTNVIFQTTPINRGGDFYFKEDGHDTIVPLKNGCMCCFSASDELHGVSFNSSSTDRMILLIDCLVDTSWVEQFMKSNL